MRARNLVVCIILTAIAVLVIGIRKANSQACCTDPTSEVSSVDGHATNPIYGGTVTLFNMEVSNANHNFDGLTVQENVGSQGYNTCYYPGSLIPEHPVVSNPAANIPPWTIGYVGAINGTPTIQHNHWGWDAVGVTGGAIIQVRADLGEDFQDPCMVVLYQNMKIDCSNAIDQYETDNALTITFDVGSDILGGLGMGQAVQNCRYSVLDTQGRCDFFYF